MNTMNTRVTPGSRNTMGAWDGARRRWVSGPKELTNCIHHGGRVGYTGLEAKQRLVYTTGADQTASWAP